MLDHINNILFSHTSGPQGTNMHKNISISSTCRVREARREGGRGEKEGEREREGEGGGREGGRERERERDAHKVAI